MQTQESHAFYLAFKSKDARFDGRFFVGVSTTGIYCRPVCPARMPKEEHCAFYETAAAEQDGYRPCLVCRPELAPGSAPMDATSVLAQRTARLIEEHCSSGLGLENYARKLGCTSRHLRRAFAAEFKVTPVQFQQTCRLLLAKSLLTDTNLSVLGVAMAAGFGSLRRFNDLFKRRYRLSPTALRKQTAGVRGSDPDMALLQGYRPPYQWRSLLDFLAHRAISGVETVRNDTYMRTVHVLTKGPKRLYGWMRVGHLPQKNALSVTISPSLLPVLPSILTRVRELFDLSCDPGAVYGTLSAMNTTHPGLCVQGTRLPGCFDAFEMTVRAVLGQQITVKAAGTLAARIAEAYGTSVETGIEGLKRVFPSANDIAQLDGDIADRLGPLGVTRSRAHTIRDLAQKIVSGELDFAHCAQPESVIKKLLAIPGIGPWTAQNIAMRAMRWPDAFPHTDYGVKKSARAAERKRPSEGGGSVAAVA